jgi:predicted nucleic acid-binding protein
MHHLTTAVLMREHGIKRVYTRDTDFHRFKSLEVVDPAG